MNDKYNTECDIDPATDIRIRLLNKYNPPLKFGLTDYQNPPSLRVIRKRNMEPSQLKSHYTEKNLSKYRKLMNSPKKSRMGRKSLKKSDLGNFNDNFFIPSKKPNFIIIDDNTQPNFSFEDNWAEYLTMKKENQTRQRIYFGLFFRKWKNRFISSSIQRYKSIRQNFTNLFNTPTVTEGQSVRREIDTYSLLERARKTISDISLSRLDRTHTRSYISYINTQKNMQRAKSDFINMSNNDYVYGNFTGDINQLGYRNFIYRDYINRKNSVNNRDIPKPQMYTDEYNESILNDDEIPPLSPALVRVKRPSLSYSVCDSIEILNDSLLYQQKNENNNLESSSDNVYTNIEPNDSTISSFTPLANKDSYSSST